MSGRSEWRGRNYTRKEESWKCIGRGDIYSLEGHTELRLPGLLGVLGCVLKGGKGVLILESSLRIHAPKL